MSGWMLCLASMVGLAGTPLPVRLEVVVVDASVTEARAEELRAWLRSSLEKEGIVFDEPSSESLARGAARRELIVELHPGQWRVWSPETPDHVVLIDAADYAIASLETLHQASFWLEQHRTNEHEPGVPEVTESPEIVDAATRETIAQPRFVAATPPLPDTGVDLVSTSESLPTPTLEPRWWTDVAAGSVVSERMNGALELNGVMMKTSRWGAFLGVGVGHVADITPLTRHWTLSLWDYHLTAGPVWAFPIGERLQFNTGVGVGVSAHTYHFTGAGWGARLVAVGHVPLTFYYQTPWWRLGVTARLALRSATFTHRVFETPMWQTERLSAALMVSWGTRIW